MRARTDVRFVHLALDDREGGSELELRQGRQLRPASGEGRGEDEYGQHGIPQLFCPHGLDSSGSTGCEVKLYVSGRRAGTRVVSRNLKAVFLFIGVAGCSHAANCRRSGVRLLFLVGNWGSNPVPLGTKSKEFGGRAA